MKNRQENGNEGPQKKAPFARMKGLLSSLRKGTAKALAAAIVTTAGVACTPEVTINNIPYVPDSGNGETGTDSCSPLTEDCQESVTVVLREPGSSAGSNQAAVENAVLTLTQVTDVGSTKSLTLVLEACEEMALDDFLPGEETSLVVAGEEFATTVSSVEYDGAGLLARVVVRPSCPFEPMPVDASVDSDNDAGSDAGSDSY